jgi:flavin reductase (DIM6/NTAB) family NADH-FMN oxidoreductase RutF
LAGIVSFPKIFNSVTLANWHNNKKRMVNIMTVNADDYKKALQHWASGVTVVTTKSERFGVQGMTATSFTSVSLDPPQILVCINDAAETGEGIQDSRHFAVNILNSDQEYVSNQFAGGSSMEDRFSAVSWEEGSTGSPVLNESLASIECKVLQQVRAGTHWIIVAEVQNKICRVGDPLLYYKSGYKGLGGCPKTD